MQVSCLIIFISIIYGLFHEPKFLDYYEETQTKLTAYIKDLNSRDPNRVWAISLDMMWISITPKQP